MLRTFADQAVIAIENVRLFTELQARNRELTEALEQQTATADILRVISRSPTDVQPVFDTIADNLLRLFDAWDAWVTRYENGLLYHAAVRAGRPDAAPRGPVEAFPPTSELTVGRCVLAAAVIHVEDVETDPVVSARSREIATRYGWRSALAAPMLRAGQVIGVISVTRRREGAFTEREIELIQTFADQAVIAVENVRLFKELRTRTGQLERSVEQLTALGEVSRAVSSTLDLDTVLNTIVTRANELAGTDGCSIFEYDEARGGIPAAREPLHGSAGGGDAGRDQPRDANSQGARRRRPGGRVASPSKCPTSPSKALREPDARLRSCRPAIAQS